MKQQCGNCRYCLHRGRKGKCAINPPTMIALDGECIDAMPYVEYASWCGQWRENRCESHIQDRHGDVVQANGIIVGRCALPFNHDGEHKAQEEPKP